MSIPRKRRKLGKEQRKAFLASDEGKEWLQRKIAEKHARRRDPGPPPERFTRTKFPFIATINGKKMLVDRNNDGTYVVTDANSPS